MRHGAAVIDTVAAVLARLAETLLPLIDEDQDTAVGLATELLQQFCREHDLLFIFDEVQANFGRTGSLAVPEPSTAALALLGCILYLRATGRSDYYHLAHLDTGLTYRAVAAKMLVSGPRSDKYCVLLGCPAMGMSGVAVAFHPAGSSTRTSCGHNLAVHKLARSAGVALARSASGMYCQQYPNRLSE